MNFANTIADYVKEKLFSPIFTNRDGLTTGRVFWVMNTSDAGYVNFVKEHPDYDDGVAAVYTTAPLAYAAMTSNQNDVCRLAAHGEHSNAMMTFSKNRCHFVGMDGGGRKNSQGSKFVTPATDVAASVAVVTNSGTRNTFRNIKFIQQGTNVAQTSGVIDTGEGTYMENCEMEVNSILSTATQGLLFKGDTCHYKGCQIGNSTVYHTAANQAPLVIQTPARYSYFEDCTIINYSSQTTASLVDAPDANSIIGWISFKNCDFICANKGNGSTAGGTIAEGITSVCTSGYILCDNQCNFYNCALACEADASILLAAADGGTATTGGQAVAGA